jgi:hypothetical protein
MCTRAAGRGDCDAHRDCQRGLTCMADVGADFGYPPGTDVCTTPGAIGGTCYCHGVVGGMCTTADDQCAAGYAPRCEPARRPATGSCGGCSCVRR